MKKTVVLLLLLINAGLIPAQKDFEKNFSSIHLATLDQINFSFDVIKKNTASVFIFLLPDCPACQSYSLTLNRFNEKFKPEGIVFYGIFPGNYNTLKEMKDFQ